MENKYWASFDGLLYCNEVFSTIEAAKKFLFSCDKITTGEVYNQRGEILFSFENVRLNQDEKK